MSSARHHAGMSVSSRPCVAAHVVLVVTGVGVVAHGFGDFFVPVGEPVGQGLNLGAWAARMSVGQRLHLGVKVAVDGQVDHRERLGVVLNHVGGERDVGVVVFGRRHLGCGVVAAVVRAAGGSVRVTQAEARVRVPSALSGADGWWYA